MISILVTGKDTDGSDIVGGYHQFKSVPRMGERVISDNRGGLDREDSAMPLRVIEVINHAYPKGDVVNPLSYIELICEVIG